MKYRLPGTIRMSVPYVSVTSLLILMSVCWLVGRFDDRSVIMSLKVFVNIILILSRFWRRQLRLSRNCATKIFRSFKSKLEFYNLLTRLFWGYFWTLRKFSSFFFLKAIIMNFSEICSGKENSLLFNGIVVDTRPFFLSLPSLVLWFP